MMKIDIPEGYEFDRVQDGEIILKKIRPKHMNAFMSFKDKETAEGFLNAYKTLIKQAAPILWGAEL